MLKSLRRTLCALASVLSSTLILSGCASLTSIFGRTEAVDVTAVACGAFKPFKWSVNDTDGTLVQIHEHNRVYDMLCPSSDETPKG